MSKGVRILAGIAMVLALGVCRGGTEESEASLEYKSVDIGLLFTTGGKGGELAGASIGAAELAGTHLGDDHGVEVTIERADYAGDLTLVPQLLSDLSKKVEAIIVASDDPAVLPSLDHIDLPIVHAYITQNRITERPNIFRVAPSDGLQAERLADYLLEVRDLDKVAIVFENTDFGRQGADEFESAITFRQGTVVAKRGFDTGGDVHTPLSAASDGAAEAAVIWTDNAAEAARGVIDAHHSAHTYQIAIPGNTAVPQFGKNAVAQVVPTAFREGILSVGPWAGPWIKDARIRRFYRDFEVKQNDIAPVRSAQVYDAVQLLSAAKAKGNIVDGLGAIENFRGASVPVSFDDSREGMDESDIWAWGFTKSKTGAGAEFFPAVDTGGGFFTLIPRGLEVPSEFRHLIP